MRMRVCTQGRGNARGGKLVRRDDKKRRDEIRGGRTTKERKRETRSHTLTYLYSGPARESKDKRREAGLLNFILAGSVAEGIV